MIRLRPASRGFTLVEVMVAVTLTGIVLAGVLTTNFQLLRSGVRITQYAEMEAQVRRGLEHFGANARNATAIQWNGATSLTLTLFGSDGTPRQMTYAWSAADQSFYVVPGADATATADRITLVQGIPAGSFSFARFDRDGNAAMTDAATKRVQVNLTTRRSTGGGAAATEGGVSATFTLRNKVVE